jgi:hypothetical protein
MLFLGNMTKSFSKVILLAPSYKFWPKCPFGTTFLPTMGVHLSLKYGECGISAQSFMKVIIFELSSMSIFYILCFVLCLPFFFLPHARKLKVCCKLSYFCTSILLPPITHVYSCPPSQITILSYLYFWPSHFHHPPFLVIATMEFSSPNSSNVSM